MTDRSGNTDSPGERRRDWGAVALGVVLAAAAAAAYARTFAVPFLFDDSSSVALNASLQHLGTSLRPPVDATVGGRPFLNFSFAIDHAISGQAVWSYHATNLAIHILAGLALFGILRRTLARRGDRAAALIAFSAGLIWTLHPLQTEAVTYIVQRAESLMGLLYLLTLYFFIRGAASSRGKRLAWFALSFAACLLGMGTKEVMVSAPLVVLLYDRTFLAGSFSGALRKRWAIHACLASTWLVLALLVLSAHGRGGTAGFGTPISPWNYALTQCSAIVHYVRLSFLPHPLVFDYGSLLELRPLRVVPCALAVFGLLALTVWGLLRNTAAGFLGACFFCILAPSSSIVPVATETMAEHRMYLALAPVVVLVVAGIYRWLGRGALFACLVAAAALALATWQRNKVYGSEESLWRDTVSKLPENERAHNNLGYTLSLQPGRLDEAIAQYGEALRLKPNFSRAHNNLGNALYALGRTDEAIAQYEETLRLRPDLAEAHYNLGRALLMLPSKLNEAIAQYGEALKLNPDFAEAHFGMGSALEKMPGRLDDAVAEFRESLRLDPDYAPAHSNLGLALAMLPGRSADAVAQFEEALKLKPDYPEAHFNLGYVLETMPGRLDDAIAHYSAAVRLKPDYAEARSNLANALNSEGRTGEALAQYEEALRLRPDDAKIHVGIALTMLKIPGRTAEAVAHLKEALRLDPGNETARQALAGVESNPY